MVLGRRSTNREVAVSFNLANTTPLNIRLLNVYGQELDVLADQEFVQGKHHFTVDLSDYANGIYFLGFDDGRSISYQKMVKN